MVKLSDLADFLDKYLLVDEIKDDSWNGLQFEGKGEVKKVGFAVDAGLDTYKAGVERGVDLIIVHHGHFWKTADPSYKSWNKDRLDYLRQHEISLYGAHLPLDRHPEVGNNAQLLKIIGAQIVKEFAEFNGKNISFIGELRDSKTTLEIEKILKEKINASCKVLGFGPKEIKTVAVCSGGGGYSTFYQALNANVDLYITGDQIERTLVAKDAKFNVIFAGHYATETVGVKALSEVIKEKFEVETTFIDLPTGF